MTSRRARIAGVGIGALVAALIAALSCVALGDAAPAAATPTVEPETFSALDALPNGNLLISDGARNEVLERQAAGAFTVIAGNGHKGFSGDGGPATLAELNDPGGLAVGSNGTIYVVDRGNARLRAILPNGEIETVVGRGTGPSPTISGLTPATKFNISVTDVAVASGNLYVSGNPPNEVFRLLANDLLSPVRGPFDGQLTTQEVEDGGEVNPWSIALDEAGDLYVANGNNYHVLEVSPAGRVNDLGIFRDATLAAADGRVAMASRNGLQWLVGTHAIAVRGFNPSILGSRPGGRIPNFFIPEPVAIASNGAVYTATNVGNTFTSVTALVVISPTGHERILWSSPSREPKR